jgi:1-acyl-sn-glycerol-3-phosphate acyltransferase
MLRIFKLLVVVSLILCFCITASLVHLFVRDVWRERAILSKVVHRFTRWILIPLDIRINVKGEPSLAASKLVVGNHLSYLDVFMLASLYPTSYVTSVEMRDTPVLGHLCRLGACVFVERRNKQNIQNEIQEITEALQRNLTVTIFPEATSTNGDEVLRFRKPLFNAAVFAQADIQPVAINYRSINNQKLTKQTRDTVCWYGAMSFAPHFIKYLGQKKFEVDIEFLSVITHNMDRDLDTLVAISHDTVKASYRPLPEDASEDFVSSVESNETVKV